MRVGTKITLAVSTVLICVGIGYGLFYTVVKQRYVRAALDIHGEQVAAFAAAAHRAGMPPAALAGVLEKNAALNGARHVRIMTGEGRISLDWNAPGFRWDRPSMSVPEDKSVTRFVEVVGETVLFRSLPVNGHGRIELVVAYTGRDASLFAGRNVDVMAVAVVTLALLLIVSQVSRRNVAHPLERLITTVERFGRGELGARHTPQEPGEFGVLAERFNGMAATIQHQTLELVREREYEHNIVDSVSTGIVGLDAKGTVTRWNRAIVRRYGVSPRDALGRPLAAQCPAVLPREVVDAATHLLESTDLRFDLEGLVHQTAHAGERILDVRGRALDDGHGGIYGVVLAVDDRTEQTHLTEQLRHAEKLATVGQLAAGLAHEIGTPLNVISGRAEFVLKKLPEGHDLRRHLSRIIDQIDRISGIVSQMLVFARKRPPQKERLELAKLVDAVNDLLSHQAEQARIALELDVPEDLWLFADPDQVQQVFMNLTLNAIQAVVSGGRITLSASTLCVPVRGDAVFVRMAVSDTGPGMDEEVAARVFDPFFTTKEPGRGTGMGLTVCHGIVTAHGGWMEVESTPGKGSTFSVFLPQEGLP